MTAIYSGRKRQLFFKLESSVVYGCWRCRLFVSAGNLLVESAFTAVLGEVEMRPPRRGGEGVLITAVVVDERGKTSFVEPEPRAEEPKLNCLLETEPEPKLYCGSCSSSGSFLRSQKFHRKKNHGC